ncbi:MAG: hypothetical protein FJZ56_00310 [Chlamydiae bacterium]|nr:hypothetical protein [Chlamydiota bacterium]
MNDPTVLIITSSGGAGHLQAAKAEELRILELYPNAKIIKQDILQDWVSKRFGIFCRDSWNKAQAAGNVSQLELFVDCQPYLEKILHYPIYKALLSLLIKEKIDRIIDTQPLGTPAIIKAIKRAKRILKKELILEKIITELPTEESSHFFHSIKKLKNEDKSLVKIITTKPLTQEGETESSFWQKQCGISDEQIQYEELPLRPSFRKYQAIDKPLDLEIDLLLKDSEERNLLLKTLKKGSACYQEYNDKIKIFIHPHEKVSVLMLGSHPEAKALFDYVKLFIEISKKKRYKERKDLLFVFCCNYKNIQKKIQDLILRDSHYPQSLTVFPLSFQDDEVIAPLLARSDATFTRSGGLTSMELLSVCKGKMWIHKSDKSELGMPPWEKGNAQYLQTKKGAEFIHPSKFEDCAKTYF